MIIDNFFSKLFTIIKIKKLYIIVDIPLINYNQSIINIKTQNSKPKTQIQESNLENQNSKPTINLIQILKPRFKILLFNHKI